MRCSATPPRFSAYSFRVLSLVSFPLAAAFPGVAAELGSLAASACFMRSSHCFISVFPKASMSKAHCIAATVGRIALRWFWRFWSSFCRYRATRLHSRTLPLLMSSAASLSSWRILSSLIAANKSLERNRAWPLRFRRVLVFDCFDFIFTFSGFPPPGRSVLRYAASFAIASALLMCPSMSHISPSMRRPL